MAVITSFSVAEVSHCPPTPEGMDRVVESIRAIYFPHLMNWPVMPSAESSLAGMKSVQIDFAHEKESCLSES